MSLAPVLLFVYKRLDCLQRTVRALQSNYRASETELIVVSDGPKSKVDNHKIDNVRKFVHQISGFKEITVIESKENCGLAKSIITGVTGVLKTRDRVIVLEDDLETSPNFLIYMNNALHFYEAMPSIFSISGYSFPIHKPPAYLFDTYSVKRACSWGWAIWKDRWDRIDWDLLVAEDVCDLDETVALGSDFPSLIKKYRQATIDSWAVPWCYHGFKKGMVTVYPTISKIRNIGFDGDATHTAHFENRYKTLLDPGEATEFRFPKIIGNDRYYTKEFLKRFSYYERFKWKILSTMSKMGVSLT